MPKLAGPNLDKPPSKKCHAATYSARQSKCNTSSMRWAKAFLSSASVWYARDSYNHYLPLINRPQKKTHLFWNYEVTRWSLKKKK